MTDNELKELVASLAIAQRETDRQLQETDRYLREKQAETDRQLRETDQRLKETDRQIRELGKQIGGLGNKFGSFTEGLAAPALEKILREKFNVTEISRNHKAIKNDSTLEIDVLGYNNGADNTAVVVEIKSHLTVRDIEQVLELLGNVPRYISSLMNKKLYGIIAAVAVNDKLKAQVLNAGLYLALITDEQFILQVPPDFQGKSFNPLAS